MIRIFDKNTENFNGNGIAVLESAQDVTIKKEINGELLLSFTMPFGDKWKYVLLENVAMVDGQCYRIKKIDHQNISAQAIYNDAAYRHIQYVPDIIGQMPRDIMLTLFDGTPVHIMTPQEAHAAGVEWVTEITDFFEASKITPIGGLQTMMATLQKYKVHCELYVDNYNIALVRTIGSDRGIVIDTKANAKSIKIMRDTSKLVTRLYPYGQDDLHIGSIMPDARQYIDSQCLSAYPGREGFMQFDAVEDPQELLKSAQWQFSEENPERIDVPQYAITVDYLDDGIREVRLGDVVTVVDRDFGTRSKQRVVSIEEHPDEPNKNKITVGNPPETIGKIFEGLVQGDIMHQIQTNDKGELKTGWLEYMQGNETVSINNDLNQEDIALYKTGALWENPDGTAAVAIINGRVAIANEKRDGNWYWTTISDGGKIIVNEVWTGVLYTSLITLMGEGAALKIENNMITFQDGSTIRARWGFDGDQYVFEMYQGDGTKTIYLDASGRAVFTGEIRGGSITSDTEINVSTDIHVGNNIYLTATTTTEGLHFLEDTTKGSITVEDPFSGMLRVSNGLVVEGTLSAPKLYVHAKDIENWMNNLEGRVAALERGTK